MMIPVLANWTLQPFFNQMILFQKMEPCVVINFIFSVFMNYFTQWYFYLPFYFRQNKLFYKNYLCQISQVENFFFIDGK